MAGSQDIKAGQAYVELSVNSKLKEGFAQAQNDMKAYGRAVEASAKSWEESFAAGIKGLRREQRVSGEMAMKKALAKGPDALVGLGASALGVGIPVAMLEVGGQLLKKIGDEAARLSSELREGKITAGELMDKLAAEIPIFGGFWAAGRSIREALTGEKHEIEQIKKEAELTKQAFDAQVNAARMLERILREIRHESMRAQARGQGATMHPEDAERLRRETERKIGEETHKVRMKEEDARYQEERQKEITANTAKAKNILNDLERAQKSYSTELTPQQILSFAKVDKNFAPMGEVGAHMARMNYASKDAEYAKWNQYSAASKVRMAGMAQEYADAMGQIRASSNQLRDKRKEIAGQDAKAQAEQRKADANEEQKREQEKTDKAIDVAERMRAEREDVDAAANAQSLQDQGKYYEAEMAMIEHQQEKKRKAIIAESADKIEALNLKPGDARYQAIEEQADKALRANDEDAERRRGEAGNKEYDRQAKLQLRLGELKAQGVEDQWAKERALIDLRYNYELDAARRANKDVADIKARQAQELTNLAQRRQREEKDAEKSMAFRLEEARIRATYPAGKAQELALLELQRKQELSANARSANPRDEKDINELYDLSRQAIENRQSGYGFGSFGGNELAGQAAMGAGSSELTDIARATEDTAKNTGDLKQSTDNLADKIDALGALVDRYT